MGCGDLSDRECAILVILLSINLLLYNPLETYNTIVCGYINYEASASEFLENLEEVSPRPSVDNFLDIV